MQSSFTVRKNASAFILKDSFISFLRLIKYIANQYCILKDCQNEVAGSKLFSDNARVVFLGYWPLSVKSLFTGVCMYYLLNLFCCYIDANLLFFICIFKCSLSCITKFPNTTAFFITLNNVHSVSLR